MVQKLEDIEGGRGSIKIGATGTISALMSRELQSLKDDTTKSQKPAILEPKDAILGTRLKEKVQGDEASTSNNEKHTDILPSTEHNHPRKASRNGSPNRNKKRSHIVEVVDIKCGMPDKTWANPIKDRLKKLSFSKGQLGELP